LNLPRRIWLPALVLLLLGLSLTLPRLGASGLWDPWEPKYAQAPREMAERGNWIVPYFHGDARLNKPPMTYWLIGASQAVFGVTEAAARLPSALLAVLCPVALCLAFAARGRELEGFLAGAALLTMPEWILLGRFATPDIPLAASLGIALAAAVAMPAARNPRGRRTLFAVAVAAVAVAGLTDWPRGLLLPAWAFLAWAAVRLRWPWIGALVVASALYYAGQHSYSLPLNLAAIAIVIAGALAAGRFEAGIRWRTWIVAIAVIVLLVTPWFLVAWRLEPDEMSIFKYKHALNLGESPKYHQGPWHDVVRIVSIGGLPWSATAVLGLLQAFRSRKRDELACALGGAGLGAFLFYALAEPRMGHFYGVMQPAVAGLAGIGIAAFMRKLDWRAIPAAAALVAITYTAWVHESRVLETATVKRALYDFDLATPVAAAVALWLVLLLVAKAARRKNGSVVCVIPTALLAGLLGMHLVPALESKKSMRPMWAAYEAERREGEPIALAGQIKFGCFYYSNNGIVELDSYEELFDYLQGGGDRYLILEKKAFRQLENRFPGGGRWEPLEYEHPSHMLVRYSPQ
jgi:4-amino-4-deoxy-L-arabinose transferase-like glycosyltransferase